MATNKDIIKAALMTAIVTHGIEYIIEHWSEILDAIVAALSEMSA